MSVDGETRPLADPFLVLATQNPIELEGTFALPEAQLDRFLSVRRRLSPDETDERSSPAATAMPSSPRDAVQPVVDARRCASAVARDRQRRG